MALLDSRSDLPAAARTLHLPELVISPLHRFPPGFSWQTAAKEQELNGCKARFLHQMQIPSCRCRKSFFYWPALCDARRFTAMQVKRGGCSVYWLYTALWAAFCFSYNPTSHFCSSLLNGYPPRCVKKQKLSKYHWTFVLWAGLLLLCLKYGQGNFIDRGLIFDSTLEHSIREFIWVRRDLHDHWVQVFTQHCQAHD